MIRHNVFPAGAVGIRKATELGIPNVYTAEAQSALETAHCCLLPVANSAPTSSSSVDVHFLLVFPQLQSTCQI